MPTPSPKSDADTTPTIGALLRLHLADAHWRAVTNARFPDWPRGLHQPTDTTDTTDHGQQPSD